MRTGVETADQPLQNLAAVGPRPGDSGSAQTEGTELFGRDPPRFLRIGPASQRTEGVTGWGGRMGARMVVEGDPDGGFVQLIAVGDDCYNKGG